MGLVSSGGSRRWEPQSGQQEDEVAGAGRDEWICSGAQDMGGGPIRARGGHPHPSLPSAIPPRLRPPPCPRLRQRRRSRGRHSQDRLM